MGPKWNVHGEVLTKYQVGRLAHLKVETHNGHMKKKKNKKAHVSCDLKMYQNRCS
jgi:hypothetical protein